MDCGVPLEVRALFVPGRLGTPPRGRRVLDLSTPSPQSCCSWALRWPTILSGDLSKIGTDSKGILGGFKVLRSALKPNIPLSS